MFIDYTFCKSKSPKLHSTKIMSVYIHKNLHFISFLNGHCCRRCLVNMPTTNSILRLLRKRKTFCRKKKKSKEIKSSYLHKAFGCCTQEVKVSKTLSIRDEKACSEMRRKKALFLLEEVLVKEKKNTLACANFHQQCPCQQD